MGQYNGYCTQTYGPEIMYIMDGIPFMEWYRIMVEATVDVTDQPE
jgi:hypothetical protein